MIFRRPMPTRRPFFSGPIAVLAGSALLTLGACETSEPTTAVIDNAYPAVVAADGGVASEEVVVYQAWWAATLFDAPVRAGASSELRRTVPESDIVYAVLARGWDPASGLPPTRLVAVRSRGEITAKRGETLHIVVSPATFEGDCASGAPLSQADADFVTERIFPGAFANVTYDAATCTATASAGAGEGGSD